MIVFSQNQEGRYFARGVAECRQSPTSRESGAIPNNNMACHTRKVIDLMLQLSLWISDDETLAIVHAASDGGQNNALALAGPRIANRNEAMCRIFSAKREGISQDAV
jgi:hypothetical protein